MYDMTVVADSNPSANSANDKAGDSRTHNNTYDCQLRNYYFFTKNDHGKTRNYNACITTNDY